MNIFIHYFADSYRKKNPQEIWLDSSQNKINNLLRQKKNEIYPPPTCWERNWISQIWAAKIMPNLVTVKSILTNQSNTLVYVLCWTQKSLSTLVFLKGKKETRWILLVWILIVSNIYDPWLLSKSWTQLFLKWPNLFGRKRKLVAKFDVGPASKQTNKQTWKKSTKWSPIQHWILNWRRRKNSSNWNGSRKKMSETTNWLRLRSHHTSFKSCRRFVPFCSYTMKIHTDTDSTS